MNEGKEYLKLKHDWIHIMYYNNVLYMWIWNRVEIVIVAGIVRIPTAF